MKVTVFKLLKYMVIRMLRDKIIPVLAISDLLQYIPSEQFVSSNVRFDGTSKIEFVWFN
jgi:hypothetical protein